MDSEEITGSEIKEYLRTNGIALEDFAKLIGVRLNTVWKWTAGRNKPSPMAQQNLKKILRKKV